MKKIYLLISLIAILIFVGVGCQKIVESPKDYMVLGFKMYPMDYNAYGFRTEKDNPLIFNDLEIAKEFAKEVFEKEEMSWVVELKIIEENFNY